MLKVTRGWSGLYVVGILSSFDTGTRDWIREVSFGRKIEFQEFLKSLLVIPLHWNAGNLECIQLWIHMNRTRMFPSYWSLVFSSIYRGIRDYNGTFVICQPSFTHPQVQLSQPVETELQFWSHWVFQGLLIASWIVDLIVYFNNLWNIWSMFLKFWKYL